MALTLFRRQWIDSGDHPAGHAPAESLLSKLCGERGVDRAIPARPFYATDLDPKQSERARAICTEAGVRDESLLDACTLDVTVLGTRAAAVVFAPIRRGRRFA